MAGLGSGRAVQRMNYAKLSKQAIVGGGGHTKAQNGLSWGGGGDGGEGFCISLGYVHLVSWSEL